MTKKQFGEERACYILEVTSILWGSQSRNSRQELDAEATEQHCVLACAPFSATVLIQLRPTRLGTAHSGLSPPVSHS